MLIHLSRDDFKKSLTRQYEILNPKGYIMHSLWYGDNVEDIGEMFSVNYNESLLSDALKKQWKIIEMDRYREMDEEDSIYVLAQKKVLLAFAPLSDRNQCERERIAWVLLAFAPLSDRKEVTGGD